MPQHVCKASQNDFASGNSNRDKKEKYTLAIASQTGIWAPEKEGGLSMFTHFLMTEMLPAGKWGMNSESQRKGGGGASSALLRALKASLSLILPGSSLSPPRASPPSTQERGKEGARPAFIWAPELSRLITESAEVFVQVKRKKKIIIRHLLKFHPDYQPRGTAQLDSIQ